MELFETLQFCSAQFLVDSKEQSRVLSFFDQLRNSESGWRDCVDIIAKEIASDDQLKFLCLQVIEHFLKTRYAHATNDDINLIRTLMLRWLEQIQTQTNVPYFLKNKMAQIFSLIFIVDFPQRWNSFLHDVFLNKLDDSNVTEFYLRVLLAIDTEVADREIQRTKEECERNTIIRDKMREVCVLDMVSSWYQILIKNMRSSIKITNLCLNSIGAYVAWIEITLIANDRFVPLIVDCLSLSEETQEAATDCVCSILTKGMDPTLKMQLVRAMDKILEDTGVYRIDQDTDVDHLIKLAEIVNCIGCVLIDCYSKFIKSPQSVALTLEILSMIEVKLNLMLSCLAHEDTLVSSCVIEFCHHYVVLLKQMVPLTEEQKKFVRQLLLVNLRRYRFPDDYDHEHEGENEAEFLEFRKELKTIFMNVGMLEGDLTMETVEELVVNTFTNWRQLDYRDIELAISLLFFLGEAMPSNQGNLFVSFDKKAMSLKKMVRLMIVSGVSQQNHVAVCLQYFETVCRYDKLFGMEQDLMPDTITSFLDERGLHHSSGRVRSRTTYLFSRFVRSQKSALQQYVGQILIHLQDLLAVSPQTTERRISAEDQLFLFETAGTLIVSGNFSAEEKRNYMQQLLGSLVSRFNEGLALLDRSRDDEERRILIDYINNIMAYASRTSKAFSNQLTMKSCLCEDIFLQLMTAFLSSIGPSHALLLNGLRQYLHRMIICLENELLPHLSPVFQKFLSAVNDLKSLTDFLTLVQQAIAKFKADIVPFLKNDMISLYSTIWRALSVQVDPMDEVATRDAQYLRRSYYQLLSVIANNKILDLWTCIGSDNLNVFLRIIVEGAMFGHDPIVQKQCFNMIHKSFDCCTAESVHSFRWLFDFACTQMLPACFAVPLKLGFDFGDAQSVMVISEIGTFIKRFFELKGEEVINIISQQLWTSAKLPQEALSEFCFALKSMDAKAFQKYLKSFFERLSNQQRT